MLLALSVISANGASMGPTAYKVFDAGGGSIGRLESNDWALPDPEKFVSSRHAVLSCDGAAFYLEDISTNGTFVNARDRAVPRDQPLRLNDGDRIFIGDYEILVQLIEEDAQAAPEPEPAPPVYAPPPPPPPPAYAQPRARREPPPYAPPPQPPPPPAPGLEPLDPLAVLVPADYSPEAEAEPAAEAEPSPHAIPNDWRTVLPQPPAAAPPAYTPPPPRPTPGRAAPAAQRPMPPAPAPRPAYTPPPPRAPAPAASTPQAAGGELELLAALGIDPARVDPAIWEQLGVIIRVVVQGMIEVLQSRAEIKNNFRMPMTSIRPVENNPLKFSLNADDALHNLFVKHNPGYLGPLESFQEGFQDITFHQMAMLAGIRAAFNAMLAKFHPESLEELYERKLKRTSMLNIGSRMKYWELYRAQFEDIEKDPESSFQLLFGEEFAKAYHEQLQRLAAAARARSR